MGPYPELTLSTLSSVSSKLAREVMGAAMSKKEKRKISRTLRGSLYLLSVKYGDDGNGSPRSVDIELRLYGPHGLGKSIDFSYSYHHRNRDSGTEHYISLLARVRTVSECSSRKPLACSTYTKNAQKQSVIAGDTVNVFYFTVKGEDDDPVQRGATLVNMQQLEKVLIGRSGVMSHKKLYNVTLAAGSVGAWDERALAEDVSALLARYKGNLEETDGVKEAKKDEAQVFDGLEGCGYGWEGDEDEDEDDKEPETGECVPMRLLDLAKDNWKA